MFYSGSMVNLRTDTPCKATLVIKIGHLMEAQATGWAVCAVPLVLGLVLAAAIATLLLK